jgi:hypothetical protein
LGKRAGFTTKLNMEEGTYDLSIDLDQIDLL